MFIANDNLSFLQLRKSITAMTLSDKLITNSHFNLKSWFYNQFHFEFFHVEVCLIKHRACIKTEIFENSNNL